MYENKLAESRRNQEIVLSSLMRRVRTKWPDLDNLWSAPLNWPEGLQKISGFQTVRWRIWFLNHIGYACPCDLFGRGVCKVCKPAVAVKDLAVL